MDEDERYSAGEFETLEEAVIKCRTIVEGNLASMFNEGVTAKELYEKYVSFGDDPWVQGGDFSAWKYAKMRCAEICPRDIENCGNPNT